MIVDIGEIKFWFSLNKNKNKFKFVPNHIYFGWDLLDDDENLILYCQDSISLKERINEDEKEEIVQQLIGERLEALENEYANTVS
jgi:hypothetical protein